MVALLGEWMTRILFTFVGANLLAATYALTIYSVVTEKWFMVSRPLQYPAKLLTLVTLYLTFCLVADTIYVDIIMFEVLCLSPLIFINS